MGSWIKKPKDRSYRLLQVTHKPRLPILQSAPSRRKGPMRLGPYLLYLASLVGILIYWYVVFSDTEFSIPAPDNMQRRPTTTATTKPTRSKPKSDTPTIRQSTPFQRRILGAARQQVERKMRFSEKYYRLTYPGGDTPADVGMSVDVVVRALRGVNVDLQKLVHEDLIINPNAYPLYRWNASYPDYNIDHRRIAILKVFLDRHARRLTTRVAAANVDRWQTGDVVIWSTRRTNLIPNHIGLVSDRRDDKGVPYVIELHPKDGVIAERRLVNHWTVVAHYRWRDPKPLGDPTPKPKALRSDNSNSQKVSR